MLLKKFGAFYLDLGVVLGNLTIGSVTNGHSSLLQLVDAVALTGLILLRQNYLLKADHLTLGLVEEFLVVVGQVKVRYFDWT